MCVTVRPEFMTDIGENNLSNLKRQGVDVIEFKPNSDVSRRLSRFALEKFGNPMWPETVAIYTVPTRIAAQARIPLIVWGENPMYEDGGASVEHSESINEPWTGTVNGLNVNDCLAAGVCNHREMLPYNIVDDEVVSSFDGAKLFLGYFVPWDRIGNAFVAQTKGFQLSVSRSDGISDNFENLDNALVGIHNYLQYLKRGYSSVTSLCANLARRRLISRRSARRIVEEIEGTFPASCGNQRIESILGALQLTVKDFRSICDRLANDEIFDKDGQGRLRWDDLGKPIRRC